MLKVHNVLILTLTLSLRPYFSLSMWKCDKVGYFLVSPQKIQTICSSQAERERNSVHYFSNDTTTQLQDIMLSSVLLIKMKVERKFSKKVAWTACVANSHTGNCGSEFCQMIAQKHFLQVYIDCMVMYPNVDNNNQETCTKMYSRIYISSFCSFPDILVNIEYLLFASEITLDNGIDSNTECRIINDITYSHIYQYNTTMFQSVVPKCMEHMYRDRYASGYASNASYHPFSKPCTLPYHMEKTECGCTRPSVLHPCVTVWLNAQSQVAVTEDKRTRLRDSVHFNLRH